MRWLERQLQTRIRWTARLLVNRFDSNPSWHIDAGASAVHTIAVTPVIHIAPSYWHHVAGTQDFDYMRKQKYGAGVKAMADSIKTLWNKYKTPAVGLSAVVPLAIAVVSALLSSDWKWFTIATLTLITYQLSFLITIVYEMQAVTNDDQPSGLYPISSNPFWRKAENKNFENVSIMAVNGAKFLRLIDENKIRVGTLRLIIASEDAIKNFYISIFGVSDESNDKIKNMINGYRETETLLLHLSKCQGIRSYDVLKIDHLPLSFFAVFGDSDAICGELRPDDARSATSGLRTETHHEQVVARVSRMCTRFNTYWDRAYKTTRPRRRTNAQVSVP